MRWYLFAALVGAVVLVAGCSRVEILYSQADRLMLMRIDDYIDLTSEQRKRLKDDIAELQAWHCREHLPEYRAFLGTLGDELSARAVSTEHVGEWADLIEGYGYQILEHAMPGIARLMAQLMPEQVDAMYQRIAEDNAENEHEINDRSVADVAEEYAEHASRHLERWLGPLDSVQTGIVGVWSRTFVPLGRLGLGVRRDRQQALREAIERYRGAEVRLEQELRAVVANMDVEKPPAYRARVEDNKRVSYRMVAAVVARMSNQQVAYLGQQVRGYRSDLANIECE